MENRLIDISKTMEAMDASLEAMKRQVFNPTSLKISKWTRFRLHFVKSHFGIDTEGDMTSVTEMKMLKDKMYITHTWLYEDGKLIREEKL